MHNQEFTIVLANQKDKDGEAHANAIYDAGCDDATVLTGDEQISVEFDRRAESLDAAIGSAARQLSDAGYTVLKIEVEAVATDS